MNRDLFLDTMKNELIKWCENRVENYHDIIFSIDYCTGKTFIRFTTQIINKILPPTEDNNGSWSNGHYIFYEINNRDNRVNISCVISQKDISAKGKEISELLINTTNKKIKKENWQYKILNTWNVYQYKENEKYEVMINRIFSRLTEIFENNISAFENRLYNSVFNKIKEVDDELISVVIEKGNVEGGKILYYTTKYERNIKNRANAIKVHGTKCMVCGFDFESMYGEIGKGFIEVHHIKPLSSLQEKVCINPSTDLVCLCSNCHRMIHKKGILSVKKLKKLIQDNKNIKK